LVALKIRPRSFRMTPVRTLLVAPPLEMIVEGHGLKSGGENRRAGHQILRRGSREFFFSWFAFGDGDVTCGPDEFPELRVGDFSRIHPEAIHVDAMNGSGVAHGVRTAADGASRIVTAHREFTSGNPHHAFRRRRRRRRLVWNRRLEDGGRTSCRRLYCRTSGAGSLRPRRIEKQNCQGAENSCSKEPF